MNTHTNKEWEREEERERERERERFPHSVFLNILFWVKNSLADFFIGLWDKNSKVSFTYLSKMRLP